MTTVASGRQLGDEDADGVVLEQRRSRGRHHHRVDDEGHGPLREEAGDGLDDAGAEEHPRLRRVDADVVEDRLELRRGRTPGGASWTAVTAVVICAVSATIALMP